MKTNGFMTKISGIANTVGFTLQKNSPEILAIAGTIGVVTSSIMACVATTKLSGIIETANDQIEVIHAAVEGSVPTKEPYTEEDGKKDVIRVYAKTAVDVVKLYAPSVIIGGFSLAGLLTSNDILRKRNVALAAAYTTIDTAFKDYRGRVVKRFGEEVDRQLRYDIQTKEVVEEVIDEETGKKKKIKKTVEEYSPDSISGYARFFEKYVVDANGEKTINPNFKSTPEYNLMFLKTVQSYANNMLRCKKRVFLNEVYDLLGFPPSYEGQAVGWVYDPENPNIDNYIDFGLTKDSLNYSDFVYGAEDAILLDFNVDGDVWSSMKKKKPLKN